MDVLFSLRRFQYSTLGHTEAPLWASSSPARKKYLVQEVVLPPTMQSCYISINAPPSFSFRRKELFRTTSVGGKIMDCGSTESSPCLPNSIILMISWTATLAM